MTADGFVCSENQESFESFKCPDALFPGRAHGYRYSESVAKSVADFLNETPIRRGILSLNTWKSLPTARLQGQGLLGPVGSSIPGGSGVGDQGVRCPSER